jgi:hypothetical protein
MTAPAELKQAPTVERRRGVSNVSILLLGVFVVPVALGVALNSYGPLTADSALRMAAATVAGQTIAILSAMTATVLSIKRRSSVRNILVTVIAATVVTLFAFSIMTAAGDQLLRHLDIVAEAAGENR